MVKQEIQQFIPRLPSTPGWTAMSERDRTWLQQHTSNAVTSFRESGFKAIQACAELALVQAFLEDKSMTFTNWVRNCFGPSERTAYRWLASYKEMRGSTPDDAILYLAQEGIAGINSSLQPREIAPVLKMLPAPRTTDKKQLETWGRKVGEELRALRSSRRRRELHLSSDDALRTFVTTGSRLMRESRLSTSAEARAWLKRGVGYLMERRTVSGSIAVERIPIPDGFLPPRGRPRKKPPAARKVA